MTDDDRALLDFAAKWWQAAGNQHDAITADPGEDLLVAVLSRHRQLVFRSRCGMTRSSSPK